MFSALSPDFIHALLHPNPSRNHADRRPNEKIWENLTYAMGQKGEVFFYRKLGKKCVQLIGLLLLLLLPPACPQRTGHFVHYAEIALFSLQHPR